MTATNPSEDIVVVYERQNGEYVGGGLAFKVRPQGVTLYKQGKEDEGHLSLSTEDVKSLALGQNPSIAYHGNWKPMLNCTLYFSASELGDPQEQALDYFLNDLLHKLASTPTKPIKRPAVRRRISQPPRRERKRLREDPTPPRYTGHWSEST